MPLFIPLALGGAALLSSGMGVTRGWSGVAAMQKAKRIAESAEAKHNEHRSSVERANKRLAQSIDAYDTFRQDTAFRTFERVFSFLERIRQRGQLKRLEGIKKLSVASSEALEFAGMCLDGEGILKSAAVSVTAGLSASALATGAATTFGAASTGTALAGLSGAAAKSAVLAYLGGGSLATGGGGMVLGAAALGGLVAAPVFLIGGLVAAREGEKALTQATEYASAVDVDVEKMEYALSIIGGYETRIVELRDVLRRLDKRVNASLAKLEPRADRFSARRKEDLRDFQMLMKLAKKMSDLLHIEVLPTGDATSWEAIERR